MRSMIIKKKEMKETQDLEEHLPLDWEKVLWIQS